MALYSAEISFELREVLLKDKPQEMLDASNKGTVPVLITEQGVLDESIEIMRWCLSQRDPAALEVDSLNSALIAENDGAFKESLDRYKYADRHPQKTQHEHLLQTMGFLEKLESRLADSEGRFLNGATPKALDIAIFPFVRQLAMVDRSVFDNLPFTRLQAWLRHWLAEPLFLSVMRKSPVWQPGSAGPVVKPANPRVQHKPEVATFSLQSEGHDEALLRYRRTGSDEVDFYSTYVPESLRGRGFAAKLVDTAHDWAVSEGLQITASCWYAAQRLADS